MLSLESERSPLDRRTPDSHTGFPTLQQHKQQQLGAGLSNGQCDVTLGRFGDSWQLKCRRARIVFGQRKIDGRNAAAQF